MKVQCGQCPAKYAVSDERIKDKKVRIHCKKCGAAIVVDGKVDPPLVTSTPARPSVRPAVRPASTAPDIAPPPEREPESRPSPRPVAHTIMGGLEAPAAEHLEQQRTSPQARGIRSPASPYQPEPGESVPEVATPAEVVRPGTPAEHRGFTDPPIGGDTNRWRVALTKQDLRWMTTSEIVDAYDAGAVKLETFVFRAGMPTWVTLLEVPEIADALSRSSGAARATGPTLPPRSPSSMPPPRKAPIRSTGALAAPDDVDLAEPLPFALVAERSNGGLAAELDAAVRAPSPVAVPAREGGPQGAEPSTEQLAIPPAAMPERLSIVERLSLEPLPPEQLPEERLAPAPFAAAQQASGSSRWVWVAAVLILLGAAVAFFGPRLGLEFF